MLIQVYRVDEYGFITGDPFEIEDYELGQRDDIPPVPPPTKGFHRPRWLNGEWTEGLSEEEIAERMKPQPVPPDPVIERLDGIEALNLDTIEQVVTLYEENLQIKAENAQLKQELMEEKEAHLNTMDAVVQLYEQVLSIEERMSV